MKTKVTVRAFKSDFKIKIATRLWVTEAVLSPREMNEFSHSLSGIHESDEAFQLRSEMDSMTTERDNYKAAFEKHRTALEQCFHALTAVSNSDYSSLGPAIAAVAKVLNGR